MSCPFCGARSIVGYPDGAFLRDEPWAACSRCSIRGRLIDWKQRAVELDAHVRAYYLHVALEIGRLAHVFAGMSLEAV